MKFANYLCHFFTCGTLHFKTIFGIIYSGNLGSRIKDLGLMSNIIKGGKRGAF